MPPPFVLRPIEPRDDARMAEIIRTVMPEFGACGSGFAINDPEVDWMSHAYAAPRSAYFVVERDGVVEGGGGVAPLEGGDADTCELRKMYFLSSLRGLGAGAEVMRLALDAARTFGFKQCYLETLSGMDAARELGFRRCYLETLSGMDAAMKLYDRSGFRRIDAPMGNTGHGGCNTFYLREL